MDDNTVTVTDGGDETITAKNVLMKVLVEKQQELDWAKSDLAWVERSYFDAQLRVKELAKKVKALESLVEAS